MATNSISRYSEVERETDTYGTWKIIAFTKGEELCSTDKIKEEAKRPYQKILFAIASGLIAALICGGIGILLISFFK